MLLKCIILPINKVYNIIIIYYNAKLKFYDFVNFYQ